MSFAVLYVCVGNVCRSPLAEGVLRAWAGAKAPITCGSAGIAALRGAPMEATAAKTLTELGGNPRGHVARQLDAHMLNDADLVLTAELTQRSVVLQLAPAVFRRTFTMREFARLGEHLLGSAATADNSEDVLRARVSAVSAQRGLVPAPDEGADDISDPFGATEAIGRQTGMTVADSVEKLITILGIPRNNDAGHVRIAP